MNIDLYDLAMADQAMKSGRNLHVGRAVLVVASHPLEGLDRIRGRTEIVLCEHLSSVVGQKPSATTAEPVKNLHELLDVDWPCPLEEGFNEAGSDLERHMAVSGLRVGEGHHADANLGARRLVRRTSHGPAASSLDWGGSRRDERARSPRHGSVQWRPRSPLEHRSATNDVRLA